MEVFSPVRFLNSSYLWLLAGVPAFFFLFLTKFYLLRRRLKRSKAFYEQFLVLKKKILWDFFKKASVVSCLWAVGVFLVSEVQYKTSRPHFFKQDVAMCWVLDVSASMRAEEGHYGPGGRLAAAQREIREFFASPQFPLGIPQCLVIFAGDVFVIHDPNPDYNIFLQKLDIVTPDFFENQGSNFELAIKTAVKMFPDNTKIKRIILLSDGDKHESQQTDIPSAVALAREKGVIIDTVGEGFEEAPIPNSRGTGFLEDEDRNIKLTIPDRKTLEEEIAWPTGGSYYSHKNRGDLTRALAKIFSGIKSKATSSIPDWESGDLPLAFSGLILLLLLVKIHRRIRFRDWFKKV